MSCLGLWIILFAKHWAGYHMRSSSHWLSGVFYPWEAANSMAIAKVLSVSSWSWVASSGGSCAEEGIRRKDK